jgi:uncharacterized protein (TIGR02117 family)
MRYKKPIKITLIVLLAIISIVPTYLLSAYILSHMSVDKESTSGDDIDLYLITNGVHTDLVMPVKTPQINWADEVKYQNTPGNDSTLTYIAFGWGDKGFYLETPTWADLRFSAACRAACGYGTSAMHATFYRQMREDSNCVKIPVSRAQYARLINFIKNSFYSGFCRSLH